MKMVQDLVAPRWANITIELGTLFSIIPIRAEVVAVRAVSGGACAHCVMGRGHPLGEAARENHVRCGSLPLCDRKVFIPTDTKSVAEYTAARLTK